MGVEGKNMQISLLSAIDGSHQESQSLTVLLRILSFFSFFEFFHADELHILNTEFVISEMRFGYDILKYFLGILMIQR